MALLCFKESLIAKRESGYKKRYYIEKFENWLKSLHIVLTMFVSNILIFIYISFFLLPSHEQVLFCKLEKSVLRKFTNPFYFKRMHFNELQHMKPFGKKVKNKFAFERVSHILFHRAVAQELWEILTPWIGLSHFEWEIVLSHYKYYQLICLLYITS